MKRHTGDKALIRQSAALLLVALALLCALPASASNAGAADYAARVAAYNGQLEALEKQQQQIQTQIARAQNEKEAAIAKKNQLNNQINTTQQQIGVLGEKINTLQESILALEEEIHQRQQRIDERYDLFKKRLRAMYTTNSSSTLGLILGAESFAEFLTRAEVAAALAEHDRELIEQMINNRTAIEMDKAEIEDAKTQVDAAQTQLGEKRAALRVQLASAADAVYDLQKLEQEYRANETAIKRQMTEVQAEIDRIYAANESPGQYEGGIMAWPVPNYSKITSDFGWRFGNTDYHTGIDISGPSVYGKPIVAAAAGKVIFVQRTYVPGRGYGIHLIIDHGGGVSTLYGHASDVYVSTGQQVARGQTVAAIGSTGWSTGPHLHFEVRVGGKYVNPWPYLK